MPEINLFYGIRITMFTVTTTRPISMRNTLATKL